MTTLPTETPATLLRQRMLGEMAMRSMRSRTQQTMSATFAPLLLASWQEWFSVTADLFQQLKDCRMRQPFR
jgi:hypothetical protein